MAPEPFTPVPSLRGQYDTTEEVAQVLRVSPRTVQEWIRTGALTAVRYGRLLRVRQADLLAFGQGLTKGAPAEPPGAAPAPRGASRYLSRSRCTRAASRAAGLAGIGRTSDRCSTP
jgi:excisionase family DNA binding protein